MARGQAQRRDRGVLARLLRDERGQSLVELALALPVLLFVVFGAIELTRGVNYWLQANHVANEGARIAMVDRLPGQSTAASAAQIQSYLASELDSLNVPATGRNIDVCLDATGSGGQAQVGDRVWVRVRLSWPLPLISAIGNFLRVRSGSTTVSIHGDSYMRVEQLPSSWTNVGTCT
jgi:hypothetical protein